MLRLTLLIACAALAVGCQQKATVAREDAPLPEHVEHEAVTASALVFDPPVIAEDDPVELSRAPRDPGVVVGYEQLIEEYFYIRLDDRQRGEGRDRYERRAITERIGVLYR